MSKILSSWSGVRKYLEKEMLSEKLRGRVRYFCTKYVEMDGSGVFELYIDDKLIKRFSHETVNSYFIKMGYVQNPTDYWNCYWQLMDEYSINERTEYNDVEFAHALKEYRNSDIQESIYSDDPIVKMFALFDRRIGKRTLVKIYDEMKNEPKWLQDIYLLRIDAQRSN